VARRVKVDLIGDASSLNRAFRSAGVNAKKFGTQTSSMRRVAGAAFRGLEVAAGSIAAIGIASVKAAATYQEQMQQIVGLSGVGQKQVDMFAKRVLALAPILGKSPQELAKALYFITSSGVAASKAMGVLVAASKASTAGLGETEVVADAVTSAMNAYGPAALSAQKATDVLVATVREGKGEASSFAGVIGNVAAIAAQLGVSFNEVGAALAAETRLGIDAETSATQLNAFFSALLKTTPMAEKALQKVGLSAAGLRQELREKGLLATLLTLKNAFGNNTAAMAKAFPNVRALRGILALVGKQAGSTAGVFARMSDTTGSLSTAFGAVSKDATFRFAQLSAAIKSIGITLGIALLPMVEKYTAELTKWLSKAKNQRKLMHDIRVAIRAVVVTMKVMIFVTKMVVRSAQGWIAFYKTVRKHTLAFYNWLRVMGIKLALAIIEPFSHLPDFLGGKRFQKMKAGLQKELASIRPSDDQAAVEAGKRISAYGAKHGTPGSKISTPAPGYGLGPKGPKTQPQHHHHHVYIDGREVTKVVTTHQHRHNRRTAPQRTGRHPGANI
jgi:TP901 family phage tail tape measure protein